MTGMLRGYGVGLTALFLVAALAWALVLIILPQLTMLERAVTQPKRALDSSIAMQMSRDARSCAALLAMQGTKPDAAPTAGPGAISGATSSDLAVPAIGGMLSVPAIGTTAPTASTPPVRPYILQCDRADTHWRLRRDDEAPPVYLDTEYGIETLRVDATAPLPAQIDMARQISALTQALATRLQAQEARAFPYTMDNFQALAAPRLIPIPPDRQQAEDARLSNRLMTLIGLRFERDGQTYERLALVTLTRTLWFAMLATALALLLCYPIAYKVALATPPDKAVWLFLGLVIPYAIVELMRIYAWTTIIDNQGLINGLLRAAHLVSEPIQFNRFPGTVFVVIVYTYVLFMVFPIYNVMTTLDRNQIDAARDLGASPLRLHWRVIAPHAKPGIAVGCIATFMLSAGAFSVPRIISRGLQAEWFSQTIYNKFFESANANVGAAYSFGYTLICVLLVALFMWLMRTRLKDFARAQ
ncbi:ABC transporter permease [Pseudooceanicola sediminis]|uniref:ABC transporter permease n=1 Tax=Pseudooceanicola sediminis TaxID=2211117 RepID=A0A399J010_9RHOB|nr:ABC transporter permease [Pseudooceanicola sediminis]KAA2313878.1 ABC transporter permease [Puniceibacterium sp. HSS470]RII38695.1 ABC transporter permease [Pseudooceanicola sediminis]|tara:strand:+ start:68843 stop:70258 length:1416 start_codon:yes stop_codon:yes gene_type:complete